MAASGGQPPFDHRKIPESPDDIDSGRSHYGCLVAIGGLVLFSLALFVLGVRI